MDTKKWWKDIAIWQRSILAFLGTCGVCYLGGIAGIEQASFSIMSVPVMMLMLGLLSWTEKRLK